MVGSLNDMASKFVKDDLPVSKCIEGAKYIIAEWISDNASYRKYIRSYFYKNGVVVSKLKKGAVDENKIYYKEIYKDYWKSRARYIYSTCSINQLLPSRL